jgi:hypothetical protein
MPRNNPEDGRIQIFITFHGVTFYKTAFLITAVKPTHLTSEVKVKFALEQSMKDQTGVET